MLSELTLAPFAPSEIPLKCTDVNVWANPITPLGDGVPSSLMVDKSLELANSNNQPKMFAPTDQSVTQPMEPSRESEQPIKPLRRRCARIWDATQLALILLLISFFGGVIVHRMKHN